MSRIDDPVGIDQHEHLQRYRAGVSTSNGHRRIRKIKLLQERKQMISDDGQISRPAGTLVLRMVDRRVIEHKLPIPQRDRLASQPQIQTAGDKQDRIPKLLSLQSPRGKIPTQAILRIGGQSRLGLGMNARHPIACRTQNQTIELLDRPTRFDKPSGQIVQKLRMRRTIPQDAEVFRRLDKPPSKMPTPNPVDDHTSYQRMTRGCKPPS